MSHSPKAPPLATTTANLPEVEDGVLAYDTTQGKPVARVAGAWENIAGGEVIGTPTVVYDDGTAVGNTDQIQGDIPNSWKTTDSSLRGLVIGTSCTRIGAFAFQNCTGLTGSLVIPGSVTSIGTLAFRACTSLTGDLVIPNSVTIIGSTAFDSCTGLTNVDCYVEKDVLDVFNSLFGTSVTTIHVRSTDSTWTAGAGQTIGGKTGITVIKDL